MTVSATHRAHSREPLPEALFGELRARLGERFTASAAAREQHGTDESASSITSTPNMARR